ncbi:hypothetical protein CAPTEDRAFT_211742 [Capitella teleta]|uniref:Uncharacterized protein n=1 Tax=Capitella teleta TaxID=283909 RepID=R7V8N1_CAPTE|nr:hypothetical protein CAPTEDRAFT_211742 [Capitella teleta]|eukprot:ELU15178.1 hypothetical protein CAPTEDRAFT_211742 [Capitella teleta]
MGKKETAALERRRRDARRQARMLASSLRVALDDADGNVLDVRFHLSELEMALDELRAVQRDHSMTLDDVDYEGDADEAYEFLKELSSLRRRALRHLEELKRSPSLTEERRPSSCSTAAWFKSKISYEVWSTYVDNPAYEFPNWTSSGGFEFINPVSSILNESVLISNSFHGGEKLPA